MEATILTYALTASDWRRWNQKIQAFVESDEAALAGRANMAGTLADVMVGVKDVIDVAGYPTRNGSDACRDAASATNDAPVVAALRAAGAKIVGKTVTTEFAFTDPTACRNPYDLRRSPGGSSSGSGAAVAAGMVDMALGTQTAGSLCRPAAYCGVVGFKPTYGVLSTKGVTPLAPSFDTIGVIARSVSLAELAFDAMRSADATSAADDPARCVSAALLLDPATEVASDTMSAFREASEAMTRISRAAPPPDMTIDVAAVVSDHRVVMNHEAHEAHGRLLSGGVSERLRPKFRAGLEAGSAVSEAEVRSARERLGTARQVFWKAMEAVDIVLTLPVPDGAPLIDGTTGFQDWLTPWTVFGGPLLCLPWGLDALGRPRSVMLAGRPGCDATLLAVAKVLEAEAPALPRPVLPD